MDENPKVYEHVEPVIEKWPINQLSLNRKQFVSELKQCTIDRLAQKYDNDFGGVLEKTIYSEIIRVNNSPWKVDPPKEKQFWGGLKKDLLQTKKLKNEDSRRNAQQNIMRIIVERYSEEIVGAFVPKTYLFARRVLTLFFGSLLGQNKVKLKVPKKGRKRKKLYSRLKVYGDIDAIQEVAKTGTVILVPTHFSNLDSTLIGYLIDAKVGIPSFSYGAGLNLYNYGPAAYFMNRMGAYRIDRRKKNGIYLEVLKTMSDLSIQKGVHTLFFPGGTRSRSGAIETNLKLGLLNTAVEAQRSVLKEGESNKIFVIPVVLNYHFVLEAKFLIRQYLRKLGRERYTAVRDMSTSKRKLSRFFFDFYRKGSEICVSFGKPMDVLGNPVDQDGKSIDKHGREVKVEDYFKWNGEITANKQRESEYTKYLASNIIEAYHQYNVVLSSTLLSYVAFKMLSEKQSGLDIFQVLALPKSELVLQLDELKAKLKGVRDHLIKLESSGKLWLSEVIYEDVESIIEDAMLHLGLFNSGKPLVVGSNGELISKDVELLYFYHNRMPDYGLDDFFELGQNVPDASLDSII